MAGKNQPSGGRLLIEARDRDIARRQALSTSGGSRIWGTLAFLALFGSWFYFGFWKPTRAIKESQENYLRSKAIGTPDGVPRTSDGRPIKQGADDLGYPRNFGADGNAEWTSEALDALELAQGAVRARFGAVTFDESRYYVVEERSPGNFRVWGRFGVKYSLMQEKETVSAPKVVISTGVFAKISAYRQMGSEPESGGILLGEFFPNEGVIRVLFASKPGESDKRSMFSFHRDARRSTRLAQALWKRSKGRIHYLGEWHTHPEDHPTPSCSDRLSMGRLLRRSTVVSGGLVLIILGRRSEYTAFYTRNGSTEVCIESDSH